MGSFSVFHWLVVAAVFLIFFGPKRLPEVAKGLGQSIKDFKKALEDDKPDEAKRLASNEATTPPNSDPKA